MRFSSLILGISMLVTAVSTSAQQKMTPELLWKLGRVTPGILTPQGQVFYSVQRYNMEENRGTSTFHTISLSDGEDRALPDSIPSGSDMQLLENGKIGYTADGQLWIINADGNEAHPVTRAQEKMNHIRISPDGNYILFSRKVKMKKVFGKDFHPRLQKSNVQIYTNLMYRHWDQWFDGTFSHVFYATYNDSTGKIGTPVDIMQGEPYNCPQQPFGGAEDFIWSPDGQSILYVSKKKYGKANAISTNTDIYEYNLGTGKTTNLTEGRKGYDTQPAFSPDGKRLAWCGMSTDGYESDKNDLMVMEVDRKLAFNLTGAWDGTVNSFRWSADGSTLFFTAPVKGTIQLFRVKVPKNLLAKMNPVVEQLTEGRYDVGQIVGQQADTLVLARQDMNHATEIFTYPVGSPSMIALTHVNDDVYNQLSMGKIEGRWVRTTDDKEELVWVIYPPDFDPAKKYPTLLYCQGGPQSEVSQFYSFRWNFQLMAANGYIIVAPNRRGLPGFGVKWNEEISKDWGGQAMQDYFSAIDSIAELPFVDTSRLGCVGASYGGYSVYMLAGIHHNRFKTFIAHDGLFDLKSWYGTTEEMWFANWDIGGPYWDKNNKAAQRSYKEFNPSNFVDKWNTPILIIQGGKDFRVPVEQGLEAFQAAQLQGIKSKLLYFPEENHWVLKPQDALVWQKEFFKWLRETL